MNYRVHEGDRVVIEETVSFPAYISTDDQLKNELANAGCEFVKDCPSGVLAWRKL